MYKSVLVVDDEPEVLKAVSRVLTREGLVVTTCNDPLQAVDLALELKPKVLLTDFRMPAMDGQQLIQKIKEQLPMTECIVLSGHADYFDMVKLINSRNTSRFIPKPWKNSELVEAVLSALHNYNQNRIKQQILSINHVPLLEVDGEGRFMNYNDAFAKEFLSGNNALSLQDLFDSEEVAKLGSSLSGSIVISSAKNGLSYQIEEKLKTDFSRLIELLSVFNSNESVEQFSFVRNKKAFIDKLDKVSNATLVAFKIRDFYFWSTLVGYQLGADKLEQMLNLLQSYHDNHLDIFQVSADQAIIASGSFTTEIDVHGFIDGIIDKLKAELDISGVAKLELTITYSLYPEDGTQLDKIIDNLIIYNQLISEAKNSFYMRYSHELLDAKLFEHKVNEALYKAIDAKEFYLKYQPKFDLRTRRIHSCEALIRWNSALVGSPSPEVFIPLAEREGQIDSIGLWVVEEACKAIVGWHKDDIEITKVNVNVSPKQLESELFFSALQRIVASYGLSPSNFELEITENYLISDINKSCQILQLFKDAGYTIAIDDFGKGYSSLSYIAKLPVDVVKIDKSLIDDLETSKTSRDVIRNVIRLVHDLGVKVIAEGIETVEQLEILIELQCDEAQGYLIGKPVMYDELCHYVF
ncbi:EAL domain-containing protein [Pseudoalteromonas fenneropenaei]|uniref:EAL domain-containing protein n=1 Tax=Pseudoalteromonas fenneropenaei TaxID=1737459 RepID=A0ABV7CFK9_9GAMM